MSVQNSKKQKEKVTMSSLTRLVPKHIKSNLKKRPKILNLYAWLLANVRDEAYQVQTYNNAMIEVKQGQVFLSFGHIKDNLGYDRSTSYRYIAALEKQKLIRKDSDKKGTLVSILDYNTEKKRLRAKAGDLEGIDKQIAVPRKSTLVRSGAVESTLLKSDTHEVPQKMIEKRALVPGDGNKSKRVYMPGDSAKTTQSKKVPKGDHIDSLNKLFKSPGNTKKPKSALTKKKSIKEKLFSKSSDKSTPQEKRETVVQEKVDNLWDDEQDLKKKRINSKPSKSKKKSKAREVAEIIKAMDAKKVAANTRQTMQRIKKPESALAEESVLNDVEETPLPSKPVKAPRRSKSSPAKKARNEAEQLRYDLQHWSIALHGLLKSVYIQCGGDSAAFPSLGSSRQKDLNDELSAMSRYQSFIKRLAATEMKDTQGKVIKNHGMGVKKLCAAILNVKVRYESRKRLTDSYWEPLPNNILEQTKIANLLRDARDFELGLELPDGPEGSMLFERFIWKEYLPSVISSVGMQKTNQEPAEVVDDKSVDDAHYEQIDKFERSTSLFL